MAKVSLDDLIAKGLLKPGDELTCEPRKGELYTATVQTRGILYNGVLYGSVAKWVRKVAGNSRNAWRDGYFNGRPLSELRDKIGGPNGNDIKGPGPDGSIQQRLLATLLKLPPASFEKAVGRVLEALGLAEVTITGRVADGGIDGDATMPVLNIRVGFQAKRYAPDNNIGIDPVQRLIGTVVSRKYDRGIFITTSSFTAGAREEAARPDSGIVLMDGQSLVDLMLKKGIGIIRVPVVRDELDEGFFEGLSTQRA